MSFDALTNLLLAAIALAAALVASGHAILYKRDVRSAIGWTGFIWIAPFVGPLVYVLFGVNRIRRKAAVLRATARVRRGAAGSPSAVPPRAALFARVGDRVTGVPMSGANQVWIHATGESAFESMLAAIETARTSVAMAMYIFRNDATGRRVIDALVRASARGVPVRVLIDAVGSGRAGGVIVEELSRRGVRSALFLPPRVPGLRSLNLRNHRKILVTDGVHAFTGGMNVGDGYALASAIPPIRDTQFEIRGPIVRDMSEAFAADWKFTTGESLEGAPWCVAPVCSGDLIARVLADGPDESFEIGRWVMLGAIASAERSIRVVTPYFVPDTTLITALNVAALRGIQVEIYIPEVLDHAIVKWASNAQLWQVLEKGCRVWFTPLPFDHSKIFTVDGVWSFFGSSNWDSRSIRLNFELNVEVCDEALTGQLDALIDARRSLGREITLAEMDGRSIPIRLRDGLARLLSPYL